MTRNRNIKANTKSSIFNTSAALSRHTDSNHDSSFTKKKARKAACDVYRLFQRRKIVTIQCAAVGIFCLLCMMRTADYYDDANVNAKEKVRHLTDNEVDAVNGHLPVSTSSLPIDTIPNKSVSPFDDESAVIPMYFVNLDSSKDRRRELENDFSLLSKDLASNLSLQRVAAVTVEDVKHMLDEKQFLLNDNVTLSTPENKKVPFVYKFAEAACILSH